MHTFRRLTFVLLVATAACAPSEPVKVTGIQLSSKVDAGNRAYSPGTTFAGTSTVYASIATEGSGSATFEAEWLDPAGATLAKQKQDVEQTEPTFYEFHFLPPGGWTAGQRYQVILTLNGTEKRTRDFEIR